MTVGTFTPQDPGFEARVRADFAKQGAMRLIGAEMTRVAPGFVEIALPFREDLSQQHGFFHAGIVATAVDSAGGYAAHSLMAAGMEVLAVEFKLNLLAPAAGERLVARGRVVRPGRTLTVCALEAFVERDGSERACAVGLQTVIGREPAALVRRSG